MVPSSTVDVTHVLRGPQMAGNVEQIPFISFVKELDYSSLSVPRKDSRNERVTPRKSWVMFLKNDYPRNKIYVENSLSYFILS